MMITVNDVISFIEKAIKNKSKINTFNRENLGLKFIKIEDYKIEIDSYGKSVLISNFDLNNIKLTNIDSRTMLKLENTYIDAEDYATNLSEYKFKHYFDNIDKKDKTIDNLDDDDD